MHDIPMSEVTPEFARCWQAAGMHIERAAGSQLNAWLRAHLNSPFLEHLSFRLGNQIFFVRVEDEEGHELMSWQANPGVDPSVWFVGNDGPEWVIVRTARHPQKDAELPGNWRTVAESCSRMSKRDNFASVSVACMQTISEGGRLYRGYPLVTNYAGLQPIHKMRSAA